MTFAVHGGGGSLSSEMPMTNSNGQAESSLTFGATPGMSTIEVNAEGISQKVVFSAEASFPPTPTTLSIVSGDNQSGLINEALTNPFLVEVRDQYHDPLEGVTVTFVVSAGGGSMSDTSVDTNTNGLAQSTLTPGSERGTNTVEVSVEGIDETVIFNVLAETLLFDLFIPSGVSLIHVPLKVMSVDGMAKVIESVGDLYDALGGAATVNVLTTLNPDTQAWQSYLGDTSADKTLTDEIGIVAAMRVPVSVRLGGDALGVDGSSTIAVNQGANVVGLPLNDSRITQVSDLLAIEGIADNVSSIIVSDGGTFKAVRQSEDNEDIPVTGGQAFILTAAAAATVAVSGDGWTNLSGTTAAPPIAITDIANGHATPILALTGSIVDEATGLNRHGFRVTVKNLSTGRVDTDVTGNEGVGYQLTVVDTQTARAAGVGDILEISAQSSDSSIAVYPLRYTVTAEDVKRGKIQLEALVAYELPTETLLLANYPNPFNPETWIPYRLAEDAFVTLTIYDGSGRIVRMLNVGHQVAAAYESRSKAVYWDGRNEVGEQVASGVYFYTLTAGNFTATRKMLIRK